MKGINTITSVLEGLGMKTWENESLEEKEPGWDFFTFRDLWVSRVPTTPLWILGFIMEWFGL